MLNRVVIVTSVGSGVGLAVQQAAALSDLRYHLIGTSSTPVILSSGQVSIQSPHAAKHSDFQNFILNLVEKVGECLLIAGRDEDAAILSDIALTLASLGGSLASGPAPAVLASYDKALTATTFGRFGLPIAATASTYENALQLGRRFGWPIVLKPRLGNASKNVRLVEHEHTLFEQFVNEQDIAQELLAVHQLDRRPWDGSYFGGQDGEYSIQVLRGRDGACLAQFASRNTLVLGVPRMVETIECTEIRYLLHQVDEILERLDAWGAWNFQGKRTEANVIKVFEVNARPTGLTGLRAYFGVNEIDLLFEALVLGQSVDLPPSPPPGRVIDCTRWSLGMEIGTNERTK